jgi:hypothetical protein
VILKERAARRAAKRSLIEPFVDEGVVPKPEPVEEAVIGSPEYVYLIPNVSSEGAAVAKAECDNPPRKILYYRLNQSTLVIKQ